MNLTLLRKLWHGAEGAVERINLLISLSDLLDLQTFLNSFERVVYGVVQPQERNCFTGISVLLIYFA